MPSARHVHVREAGEDLACPWPGEVHRREAGGHVGDVDPAVRRSQPPAQPTVDRIQAAGAGRDEEPVVTKARDRAVVQDDPGIVGHRPVADPAHLEVAEPVRMEPVEKGSRRRGRARRACRGWRHRSARPARGRSGPPRRRHRSAAAASSRPCPSTSHRARRDDRAARFAGLGRRCGPASTAIGTGWTGGRKVVSPVASREPPSLRR